MSRIIHCGCCGETGHTIRTCQDPSAIEAETLLLTQTNLEVALNMCDSMNPRHIAYILAKNQISRGNQQFNLEKLKNKIHQILSSDSVPTPPPHQTQSVRQQPNVARSIEREIGRLTRELLQFENEDGINGCITLLSMHPSYSPFQNTILSNCQEFNAITTAYAKIILCGLYKFIGGRSVDEQDFNSKCFSSIANREGLQTCIRIHMNRQHIVFCENTISYIISKMRLAYYRLFTVQPNFPRRENILQRIYPRVPSEYFESRPIIESIYQPFVFDLTTDDTHHEPDVMKQLKITVNVCDTNIPNDVKCSVCWNEELTQDQLIKTGCNHVFCAECITGIAHTRGIKTFIKCPCCRDEISVLCVSNNDQLILVNDGLAPITPIAAI